MVNCQHLSVNLCSVTVNSHCPSPKCCPLPFTPSSSWLHFHSPSLLVLRIYQAEPRKRAGIERAWCQVQMNTEWAVVRQAILSRKYKSRKQELKGSWAFLQEGSFNLCAWCISIACQSLLVYSSTEFKTKPTWKLDENKHSWYCFCGMGDFVLFFLFFPQWSKTFQVI